MSEWQSQSASLSINPKNLIVQEGLDVGRIAAVEFSEIVEDNTVERCISGLPIVGAYAENQARDSRIFDGYNKITTETEYSSIGMKAIYEEIGRRAIESVPPYTDKTTKKQVGEAAVERFMTEVMSKSNEQYLKLNEEAQELLNEIRGTTIKRPPRVFGGRSD